MRGCWLVMVAACGFAPTLAGSDAATRGTSDGPSHDARDDAPVDAARDAFVGYAIRYNIGGAQVTGIDHPGTWLADTEPGGLCDCTVYPAPTDTTSINGTADIALYAKLPYAAPLECSFPNLPSGTYTIELLFAETYRGNAPCVGGVGDRQLTITMQGTVVDALYDLGVAGNGCAVVADGVDGGGRVADKTYADIAITDGTLDLVISGNAINGILDGIAIVQTAP